MNRLSNRAFPIYYGLGNLGANIFSQAFATFILFFYVDHLRAPLGPITAAMSIQSIWHAVLNPAMGLLSDRTHSRWGRRIPYIAGAFLPLGFVFWLLWHPLTGPSHIVLYFFMAVAMFDALYLLVVINWTSLFPELFRTLDERTRVARWRQAIGIVALMLGVSIPPLLYGRWGWSAMGAILAALGTLGFAFVILGYAKAYHDPAPVALPLLPPSRRIWQPFWQVLKESGFPPYLITNFLVQFVLLLIPATMPFYAKYVLHLTHGELSIMLGMTFIVAIIMVYPWSRFINRYGSRRSIRIAIGILTIAVLPFFFVTTFAEGVLTTMMLGIGLSGFLMLIDIIMAELIDEHERHQRVRREATFYGINGFILRFGTTVEALSVYAMFHFTGYHANSAGTASLPVREGMRFLMAGVPFIALVVALWIFARYRVPESPRSM